jgi:hypothetical protein
MYDGSLVSIIYRDLCTILHIVTFSMWCHFGNTMTICCGKQVLIWWRICKSEWCSFPYMPVHMKQHVKQGSSVTNIIFFKWKDEASLCCITIIAMTTNIPYSVPLKCMICSWPDILVLTIKKGFLFIVYIMYCDHERFNSESLIWKYVLCTDNTESETSFSSAYFPSTCLVQHIFSCF